MAVEGPMLYLLVVTYIPQVPCRPTPSPAGSSKGAQESMLVLWPDQHGVWWAAAAELCCPGSLVKIAGPNYGLLLLEPASQASSGVGLQVSKLPALLTRTCSHYYTKVRH